MGRNFHSSVRRVCVAALVAATTNIAIPVQGVDRGPDRCAGFDSFYIGDGCSATLAECLKRTPSCPLAIRLRAFAMWIDTLSPIEPCSAGIAAIAERYAFFTDTLIHAAIDNNCVTFVGSPSSPISIIVYVSAICPLCKRVYKGLYVGVTDGSLRGIARLGIKVISSRPWDLALLAARHVNKQSAFFLSLAGVEERISMQLIRRKATLIGLSPALLDRLTADSTLLREAVLSASEASKNGVTLTPTIFINGRQYRSYKDPQWIADAVLYMHETGKLTEPTPHAQPLGGIR